MNAPVTSPEGRARLGRTVLRGALMLLVALVLLAGLYTWAVLSYTYSEGERAGYVQKFSKKGWICKTWEGEMQIIAFPGAMPQLFPFTVRDDAVAAQIEATMGKQVKLHYGQHVGIPTTCFGDTSYFVQSVQVLAK